MKKNGKAVKGQVVRAYTSVREPGDIIPYLNELVAETYSPNFNARANSQRIAIGNQFLNYLRTVQRSGGLVIKNGRLLMGLETS